MDCPAEKRGALVVAVTPGGPAEAASLHVSEDIVKMDGPELAIGGDILDKGDAKSFGGAAAKCARP